MKNTILLVEPRILSDLEKIIEKYQSILKHENWNFVFYCGKTSKEHWDNLLKNVELRTLDVDNFNNANEYSDFMKKKELWSSLKGEYILTIQADTWITNNSIPIDFFIKLNKSYIGGNQSYPWFELQRENIFPKFLNFNGGLSLRKRQHMIDIIEKFPPQPCCHPSYNLNTDAEDVYFTIGCIKLGYSVGDDELSSYFCIHTIFKPKFFAIHQPDIYTSIYLNNLLPNIKHENKYLKISV